MTLRARLGCTEIHKGTLAHIPQPSRAETCVKSSHRKRKRKLFSFEAFQNARFSGKTYAAGTHHMWMACDHPRLECMPLLRVGSLKCTLPQLTVHQEP
jgi:hypothetical protein